MTTDSDEQEVLSLLTRIEQNQQQALSLQREQLDLTRKQLERSNESIQESMALQRTAVARQALLTRLLLPIIGVVVLLLAYFLYRWNFLL